MANRVVMPLVAKNQAFKTLHAYYTTRIEIRQIASLQFVSKSHKFFGIANPMCWDEAEISCFVLFWSASVLTIHLSFHALK